MVIQVFVATGYAVNPFPEHGIELVTDHAGITPIDQSLG
jgi:hypothetical protein